MIGRDTEEEIARLTFCIKEIEKVEASFDEKTVLNLFGECLKFENYYQRAELANIK